MLVPKSRAPHVSAAPGAGPPGWVPAVASPIVRVLAFVARLRCCHQLQRARPFNSLASHRQHLERDADATLFPSPSLVYAGWWIPVGSTLHAQHSESNRHQQLDIDRPLTPRRNAGTRQQWQSPRPPNSQTDLTSPHCQVIPPVSIEPAPRRAATRPVDVPRVPATDESRRPSSS